MVLVPLRHAFHLPTAVRRTGEPPWILDDESSAVLRSRLDSDPGPVLVTAIRGPLQQRHLRRSAFAVAFLTRDVMCAVGSGFLLPLRVPVVLEMLARPLDSYDLRREHDTRRHSNELTHKWNLLDWQDVEMRGSVLRAAVPHFNAAAGEGSPSSDDRHLRAREYLGISICRSGEHRPLTADRPIVPVR